jgi:hypothetical protein
VLGEELNERLPLLIRSNLRFGWRIGQRES